MHATGPRMRIASAISRVPEYIRPVHSVTGTPRAISAAIASASLGCTSPSAPSSVPSISVTKTFATLPMGGLNWRQGGCAPRARPPIPSVRLSGRNGAGRIHGDALLGARIVLVGHEPVDQRVERVVTTHADVAAGVDGLTHLANQDAAGANFFAAVDFDTTVLGVRATTVARRAAAFFMCHYAVTPVRPVIFTAV